MARLWILFAIGCFALQADDRTQRLTARLSQEAEAFRKIAPDLVGKESLLQRAVKPAKGLRIRIGSSAQHPPEPVWQERRILSEYTFAAFSGEGGAFHEIRRVTSVDGRKVQDSNKAQQELAAILTGDDEKRKKELLKQFEQYGLVGAVTDFGQLLLLFNPQDVLRYEFTFLGVQNQGAGHVLVFGYQQIDGPGGLTVIDGARGSGQNVRIGGEVWVRENDFLPVRITLASGQGEGQALVREEASVDYAESAFGTILPFRTEHRELRGGKVVVENQFSYSDFHKFGAK